MIVSEAKSVVEGMLAPFGVDRFFDLVRASRPAEQAGGPSHPRAALLGSDPQSTLLSAFATHAQILDCHATTPCGPPPGPADVADASAFRALIEAYHDRGYTVRIPEVRALAAPLLSFTRALEALLCQRVEASAFWSRAGARAKIHYDDNDNISVQLSGRKRWYISTDPAGLQNTRRNVAEPQPHLERHRVIDVGPGDLVYVPRGTPHSVASTTDSLHVSILFTPLTLRSAITAVLDHMSDHVRPYRATAAAQISGVSGLAAELQPVIVAALAQLTEQARQPGFVEAALNKRANREVGKLERLVPTGTPLPELTPDTRIRHATLAMAHLFDAGPVIDLALPGGHLSIHAGAARALAFVTETPSFDVRDTPGLAPDVSIALIERLIAAGFLELDR